MITITKNGNAVLFEFEENQHYLYNGTIEVPLNSLSLVTDESEMFTFKKAATNDIFISARYDDVNMSKSQLIDFYIANMVGSGNSESGITSGDVQTMINTSLEDYYDIDEIDAALSGKQDTLIAGSGITISGDVISAEGGNLVIELTQAEYDALVDKDPNAFYIITDATEINISDYYTSAQTQSAINAAVSGKADTSAVTEAITAAVSGKADTSAITTSITSASTDAQVPSAKAVYDSNPWFILQNPNNSQRGVVSKLAEYYDTNIGQQSYIFGSGNPWSGQPIMARNQYSYAFGLQTSAMTQGAVAEGRETLASGLFSHSEGEAVKATNTAEHSQGRYNVSNQASVRFGDSGNTLFSVGNGTSDSARHNAFEIRQNGDIYITKDGADVKLQDNLGGGVSESAFTSYSAATAARISEDEEVTAAALNALNDGKQDTLIAGSGITISGNVISAIGGGGGIDSGTVQTMIDGSISGKADTSAVTEAINSAVSGKADSSAVTEISSAVSGKMDTSVFNTYSAATNARISEDEEVTAAALNALNDRVDAIDITVDDALDATSENPVQNKVIYAVIGDIESLLSNI